MDRDIAQTDADQQEYAQASYAETLPRTALEDRAPIQSLTDRELLEEVLYLLRQGEAGLLQASQNPMLKMALGI